MSPAEFIRCAQTGGRVRTKKLSNNRFIKFCFKGGKSFAGEVKTRKTKA